MRSFCVLVLLAASATPTCAVTVQSKQASATATACVSQFDFEEGRMIYENLEESIDAPGNLALSDVASAYLSTADTDGSLSVYLSGEVRPRGQFRLGEGCRSASLDTSLNIEFSLAVPADVVIDASTGPEYSEPSLSVLLQGPSMQEVWRVQAVRESIEEVAGLQFSLPAGTYNLSAAGSASLAFSNNDEEGRNELFTFSMSLQETAVPEPSTFAMLVGCASLLFGRRRLRALANAIWR